MITITERQTQSDPEPGDRIEPCRASLALTDDHDAAIDRLRRERDLITAVLDRAGALVIILDRQRRLVHVSRLCEQVIGYTCEQVRGQCFRDKFIPPPLLYCLPEIRSQGRPHNLLPPSRGRNPRGRVPLMRPLTSS